MNNWITELSIRTRIYYEILTFFLCLPFRGGIKKSCKHFRNSIKNYPPKEYNIPVGENYYI